MKVFISWSGDRSKRVAELINAWIKCVIQSVQPWISSQDISRGELWYNAINKQVSQISTGIICLTKDHKDKPWILFEAGALAKGLDTSHILTFLIDLTSEDLLLSPLSAFNHTSPDKIGVRKMMLTINSLVEIPLDETTFDTVFEKFWPDFERQFHQIIDDTTTTAQSAKQIKEDPQTDLIKELIKSVRNLETSVYQIRNNNDVRRDENEFRARERKYAVKKDEMIPLRAVDEDMLKMLAEKFKK